MINQKDMTDQKIFRLPATAHLFLIKDGKILLLRRYNTGFEDGNYGVPAGHIDGDETIANAMKREALEEANIKIKNPKVVHVMHWTRKRDGILDTHNERLHLFFVADRWSGEVRNTEPDKCDHLDWFDIDGLPINTIPYVLQAINNYKNQIIYSEYGWK